MAIDVAAIGIEYRTEGLEKGTRALRDNEKQANKTADAADNLTKSAERSGRAIGLSIAGGVTGAIAAVAAINKLIEGVAKYQDIAEKTGGSASGFASLRTAADVAGTSVENAAQAANRLSVSLSKVDDEGKGAGKALAAIGLDLDKFRKLSPDEQLREVGRAMNGYEDSASKAAVANALFGRGGAEMLPFLKELGNETQRMTLLTDEQIASADDYADANARTMSEIKQLAEATAMLALPAMSAFSGAVSDTIKDILGLSNGVKDLSGNTGVQDFATSAVRALGFVIDMADGVVRVFQVIGNLIGAEMAAAAALATGEFRQAKAIMEDFGEKADSILSRKLFSAHLEDRLTGLNSGEKKLSDTAKKPGLNFNTATGKKGKDDALAIAKAQRDADLDSIRKSLQLELDAYKNAEKIMEAVRSAGMISEDEYYASRRAFIRLNAQANEDASSKEIARLNQMKLSGKDKIENDRKILDVESKLAKTRDEAATELHVLDIQEAASKAKVKRSYEEARLAAQEYLDTLTLANRRNLDAFGQGDAERNRISGRAQIEDRYTQQRNELENAKRLLEFEGKFTDDARNQYQARLGIIKEFQGKALEAWDAYYTELKKKEGDWTQGASRAIENYRDSAANVAGQTERLYTSAFQGMEDALVKFVTTGKLDFKSLADSIVAGITRIIIQQQMAKAMGGGGSGGGWLGSILGTVLGGGGGGFDMWGGATGAQNSAIYSAIIGSANGNAFGPSGVIPFANGGVVDKPTFFQFSRGTGVMGEAGPEAIMPLKRGADGKLGVSGGGQQLVQHISFAVNGPITRETQQQIAARIGTSARRAVARNT